MSVHRIPLQQDTVTRFFFNRNTSHISAVCRPCPQTHSNPIWHVPTTVRHDVPGLLTFVCLEALLCEVSGFEEVTALNPIPP